MAVTYVGAKYSVYANHLKEDARRTGDYKVTNSSDLIYTVPWTGAEESILVDAKVSGGGMGKAGFFEFSVYPDHPLYDRWMQMRTTLRVMYGSVCIFFGRVLTIDTDHMTGKRKIHCEGALSYLLDTVIPGVADNDKQKRTIGAYIDYLLNEHNSQLNNSTDLYKHIQRGIVPGYYTNALNAAQKVSVLPESQKFGESGWQSTSQALSSLVSNYGGYMRIRYDDTYPNNEDQQLYLDWLDGYYEAVGDRVVKVSENVLSMSDSTEVDNIFTMLIPIGSRKNTSKGDKNLYLKGTRYLKVPDIVTTTVTVQAGEQKHTLPYLGITTSMYVWEIGAGPFKEGGTFQTFAYTWDTKNANGKLVTHEATAYVENDLIDGSMVTYLLDGKVYVFTRSDHKWHLVEDGKTIHVTINNQEREVTYSEEDGKWHEQVEESPQPRYTEAQLSRGYATKKDFEEALNKYGRIYKTVSFNNATTREELEEQAWEYIRNHFHSSIGTFTVNALDLNFIEEPQNDRAKQLIVGDRVLVRYPETNAYTLRKLGTTSASDIWTLGTGPFREGGTFEAFHYTWTTRDGNGEVVENTGYCEHESDIADGDMVTYLPTGELFVYSKYDSCWHLVTDGVLLNYGNLKLKYSEADQKWHEYGRALTVLSAEYDLHHPEADSYTIGIPDDNVRSQYGTSSNSSDQNNKEEEEKVTFGGGGGKDPEPWHWEDHLVTAAYHSELYNDYKTRYGDEAAASLLMSQEALLARVYGEEYDPDNPQYDINTRSGKYLKFLEASAANDQLILSRSQKLLETLTANPDAVQHFEDYMRSAAAITVSAEASAISFNRRLELLNTNPTQHMLEVRSGATTGEIYLWNIKKRAKTQDDPNDSPDPVEDPTPNLAATVANGIFSGNGATFGNNVQKLIDTLGQDDVGNTEIGDNNAGGVVIDGKKNGGTVKAGVSQTGSGGNIRYDWNVKINVPFSYTKSNGQTVNVPAGMIQAKDFGVDEIPSFKTKLAVVDTLVANTANINKLCVSMQADIKQLRANRITTDTLVARLATAAKVHISTLYIDTHLYAPSGRSIIGEGICDIILEGPNSNNVYTLKKKCFNEAVSTIGTFSRAVTDMSGAWGSENTEFTITPQPQGTPPFVIHFGSQSGTADRSWFIENGTGAVTRDLNDPTKANIPVAIVEKSFVLNEWHSTAYYTTTLSVDASAMYVATDWDHSWENSGSDNVTMIVTALPINQSCTIRFGAQSGSAEASFIFGNNDSASPSLATSDGKSLNVPVALIERYQAEIAGTTEWHSAKRFVGQITVDSTLAWNKGDEAGFGEAIAKSSLKLNGNAWVSLNNTLSLGQNDTFEVTYPAWDRDDNNNQIQASHTVTIDATTAYNAGIAAATVTSWNDTWTGSGTNDATLSVTAQPMGQSYAIRFGARSGLDNSTSLFIVGNGAASLVSGNDKSMTVPVALQEQYQVEVSGSTQWQSTTRHTSNITVDTTLSWNAGRATGDAEGYGSAVFSSGIDLNGSAWFSVSDTLTPSVSQGVIDTVVVHIPAWQGNSSTGTQTKVTRNVTIDMSGVYNAGIAAATVTSWNDTWTGSGTNDATLSVTAQPMGQSYAIRFGARSGLDNSTSLFIVGNGAASLVSGNDKSMTVPVALQEQYQVEVSGSTQWQSTTRHTSNITVDTTLSWNAGRATGDAEGYGSAVFSSGIDLNGSAWFSVSDTLTPSVSQGVIDTVVVHIPAWQGNSSTGTQTKVTRNVTIDMSGVYNAGIAAVSVSSISGTAPSNNNYGRSFNPTLFATLSPSGTSVTPPQDFRLESGSYTISGATYRTVDLKAYSGNNGSVIGRFTLPTITIQPRSDCGAITGTTDSDVRNPTYLIAANSNDSSVIYDEKELRMVAGQYGTSDKYCINLFFGGGIIARADIMSVYTEGCNSVTATAVHGVVPTEINHNVAPTFRATLNNGTTYNTANNQFSFAEGSYQVTASNQTLTYATIDLKDGNSIIGRYTIQGLLDTATQNGANSVAATAVHGVVPTEINHNVAPTFRATLNNGTTYNTANNQFSFAEGSYQVTASNQTLTYATIDLKDGNSIIGRYTIQGLLDNAYQNGARSVTVNTINGNAPSDSNYKRSFNPTLFASLSTGTNVTPTQDFRLESGSYAISGVTYRTVDLKAYRENNSSVIGRYTLPTITIQPRSDCGAITGTTDSDVRNPTYIIASDGTNTYDEKGLQLQAGTYGNPGKYCIDLYFGGGVIARADVMSIYYAGVNSVSVAHDPQVNTGSWVGPATDSEMYQAYGNVTLHAARSGNITTNGKYGFEVKCGSNASAYYTITVAVPTPVITAGAHRPQWDSENKKFYSVGYAYSDGSLAATSNPVSTNNSLAIDTTSGAWSNGQKEVYLRLGSGDAGLLMTATVQAPTVTHSTSIDQETWVGPLSGTDSTVVANYYNNGAPLHNAKAGGITGNGYYGFAVTCGGANASYYYVKVNVSPTVDTPIICGESDHTAKSSQQSPQSTMKIRPSCQVNGTWYDGSVISITPALPPTSMTFTQWTSSWTPSGVRVDNTTNGVAINSSTAYLGFSYAGRNYYMKINYIS